MVPTNPTFQSFEIGGKELSTWRVEASGKASLNQADTAKEVSLVAALLDRVSDSQPLIKIRRMYMRVYRNRT